MHRIRWVLGLVAFGIGVLTPLGATAQDAANPFADLGLPEIAVTITDTALEGLPAELAAGRYVLAVTNNATPGGDPFGDSMGVGFIQPPDGMTGADFVAEMAMMAGPPPASPMAEGEMDMAAGSPMAEGAAEGEMEMGGPPPWYFEVALAGGVYATAGETAYTVLDLAAGEWVLWTEDPAAPQPAVPVVVTGEPPADQATPEADVTISMVEMAFALDQPLAVGPQIIALTNDGEQPHFLGLAAVPAGTTVDDVLQLSATFMDPMATPPANLSFEQLESVLDTPDLSSGMTNWYSVDLAPGDYLLICLVPDQETGMPHALMGMIDIVTVAE